MANGKTVIVTGASQGIGAAIVQAFLDRGYSVVATSRSISKAGFAPSPNLVLVDGDIGQAATAEKVAGSWGLTPKSWLDMSRVSPSAASRPAATPSRAILVP